MGTRKIGVYPLFKGIYTPDQRSAVWNDFLYRAGNREPLKKASITVKGPYNECGLNINEIMKFEEYQSEASQTALYPRRMSNLEYPTLGLAGEAGEVANIVKKIQRDFGGRDHAGGPFKIKGRARRCALVYLGLCG